MNIALHLPEEIRHRTESEGNRGGADIQVYIESISVAANIVTVATFRSELAAIARGIRYWATRKGPEDAYLIVKGVGIDVRLPLAPNTSVGPILDALERVVRASEEAAE